MHHRSKRKVFDGKDGNNSSITNISSLLQKLRTSSTLTKKTLHSKSTYFYRWGSSDGNDSSNRNSTNEFRERSRNRIPYGAVISTRARRETNSYSRIADWKSKLPRLSYVIPTVCTLALLVGGIATINPSANNTNKVFAEESANSTEGEPAAQAADSAISLRLNTDANLTTPATAGEVAYITSTFTVNVSKYTNYTVKLSAMNGSGTELHGKENPTALIRGVGNNVLPANFSNNTWGYSYNDNINADKTTLAYKSVPAYGSEESMFTKNLTGAEVDAEQSYLLAFAAKIGSDSPADHYVGNFLLSVVGNTFNPETYTLTYNPNNGSNTPGSQSCTQSQVNAPCNISITSSTPTRTDYTFKGWADNASDTTAKYSAGSTISLSSNKTIYAVWEANLKGLERITTMQEMTSSICADTPEGESKQLKDTRDSKIYWVTKLKDGNCWMTQNLAYNGGGTARTYNGSNACMGWTDNNSVAQYCAIAHTNGDHASRGNYYSWPAAMNGDTSATGAVQGVCPANWRLPTEEHFNNLKTSYGYSKTPPLQNSPVYLVIGGYVQAAGIEIGETGSYWTSVPNGDTSAKYFNIQKYANSSGLDDNAYKRYSGYSVRCLAQ